MAFFDDILSGGNWLTGLALGVGTVVVLPLAAPILRPLAKSAIKGGIPGLPGRGWIVRGVGDLVAEAVADSGGVATQAREGATHASEIESPRSGGSRTRAEVSRGTRSMGRGPRGHGNG
jgi:hypothetical protein